MNRNRLHILLALVCSALLGATETALAQEESLRERDLDIRSAKWPIDVDIRLSWETGAPRMPAGVREEVLSALAANPRRLITLDVKGAPLLFERLPSKARRALLDRSGNGIQAKYDGFVASQIVELMDSIRAAKPRAPLAVKGVPFEGGVRNRAAANGRYAEVIDRLSAFVASNSVVVGRTSREKSLVLRSFVESLRLVNGRPLIYRGNDHWRMVLVAGGLAHQAELDKHAGIRGLGEGGGTGALARHGSSGTPSGEEGTSTGDDPTGAPDRTAAQPSAVHASPAGSSSPTSPRLHDGKGGGARGGGGGGASPAARPSDATQPVPPDSASNPVAEPESEEEDGTASDDEDAGDGDGDDSADSGDSGDSGDGDDAGDSGDGDDSADSGDSGDSGDGDDAGDSGDGDDAGDSGDGDEWDPEDEVDDSGDGDDADDGGDAGDGDDAGNSGDGEDSGDGDDAGDSGDGDDAGDSGDGDDAGDSGDGDDDGDSDGGDDSGDSGGSGGSGTDEDVQTLVAGSGFDGLPVAPDPIGQFSDPGGDAKVIARWNLVSDQDVTGTLQIGVVAFHTNGIERVAFSLEGGPWLNATNMGLNPATDTYEYSCIFDAAAVPDGRVEIRAIAYPLSAGIPRALQGEFEYDTSDATDRYRVYSGNYALNLWANSGGTLPSHVFYCDPSGQFSGHDGSTALPFRQPSQAIRYIRDNFLADSEGVKVNGVTIYLNAGDYEWGPDVSSNYPQSNHRWLTVRPAPGVAGSDVRIVSTYSNGIGRALKRVRIKDIVLHGTELRFTGQSTWFWFDGIMHTGADMAQQYTFTGAVPMVVHGYFATDVTFPETTNGLRGIFYMRNCNFDKVSKSCFGGSPMTVNCSAGEYVLTNINFHGDLWHWFQNNDLLENVICYNVTARDWAMQGWFAEARPEGDVMDNVALINVSIGCAAYTVNGSPWGRKTNHLLIWHCDLINQHARWYADRQCRNVSIRENVFARFMSGSNYAMPSSFPASLVRDNHFTDGIGGVYGPDGLAYTMGDPGFIDEAAGNYHPSPLSPLRNRVAEPLVPADADGQPFANGSIGAHAAP